MIGNDHGMRTSMTTNRIKYEKLKKGVSSVRKSGGRWQMRTKREAQKTRFIASVVYAMMWKRTE